MAKASKKTDLKTAVIGYGGAFNMGRQHFQEMIRAGMTPVAVCDLDPARRAVAEQEFPGIRAFAAVSEMLKKSGADLVTLITPHNTHAKLAIQCLNAGKHVVTEKPMAITTAECDAMIAAAKKNKRMLSAYHNRHWDGCILQAAKTIRSGAIGDIHRILVRMGHYGKPQDWWRARKSIAGGMLHDWGVHLLEYTLQLANAKIVEVSGFARSGYWAKQVPWKNDCIEDEAAAIVRFDSGAWAMVCMTSLDTHGSPAWIEITGSKGSYLMNYPDWEIVTAENGETVRRKGQNPEGEQYKYYQNIADHLSKGKPLVITAEWARRPIHIIDLAGKSAAKGGALKAQYK